MILSPTTKMLKLAEVAEELGVAQATVELWVKDKDLGSFRKGKKCRRVSLECLTTFVLQHTLNPRRPAWLTPEVESKFQLKLREMIEQAFNAEAQRRQERIAA